MKIWRIVRSINYVDNFVPSLLTVLDNTVRPARHANHAHLIPFDIQYLIEEKELNEVDKKNYYLQIKGVQTMHEKRN